ncbi:MAG: trypsin-like peptidase domain-containing protein [Planctomycetota bacterium]
MVCSRFALTLVSLFAGSAAIAQQVELLSFGMPGCGPCRAMAPLVAQLEAEGVPVRRVDGTQQPQLAAQLRIDSYPTFVAVSGGQEVRRAVGAMPYEQLRQLVTVARPTVPSRSAANTFAPTSGRTDSLAQVGGDWGPGRSVAPTPASAEHARLLASSVRLTVTEGTSSSYGTGTIIDARQGEALVVTCAHLFRDENNQPLNVSGRLQIELFDASTGAPKVSQRVAGELVSYDFDADVALVAIRADGVPPTLRVASSPGDIRPGDGVRSVGCDLGADPTVRESRVVDLNRYNGPPNIETTGAPVQGRSGGGLFNAAGQLIGICNFADDAADEGIYAGLASIHAQLDRVRLTELYRTTSANTIAAAPAAQPPVAATPASRPASDDGLAPVERTPVIRGQNAGWADTAPAATASLNTQEQAAFGEIVRRGERAEVMVVIHPEDGSPSQVLTLDSASPEFVAALTRLGQSR